MMKNIFQQNSAERSSEGNETCKNGEKSESSNTVLNDSMSSFDQDPEQTAYEEYMKKLMSFRKDELVIASDSSESEDDESKPQKEKLEIKGVDDAFEIAEYVEDRIKGVYSLIRGVDKRMAYNLRLFGSVIFDAHLVDMQKK